MKAGAKHVTVADINGIVNPERDDIRNGDDEQLKWIADHTNPERHRGTLKDALKGADVFIGVSAGNILTGDDTEALKRSAQIEGFSARGLEVLLLSDHVDAFWPEALARFEAIRAHGALQMVDVEGVGLLTAAAERALDGLDLLLRRGGIGLVSGHG